MAKEMVLVDKIAYYELLEKAAWLDCLERAGVDNWEGIGFAYELQSDYDEEEDDE